MAIRSVAPEGTVVLGEGTGDDAQVAWARIVNRDEGLGPWLVIAAYRSGDRAVRRLRVGVGGRELRRRGPVAILDRDELPTIERRSTPISVVGLTADGKTVPAQ